MLKRLSNSFKAHAIGLEYPGYGICFKEKVNAKTIIQRSKRLYEFLTNDFGYNESDIIIFGRSLGSGAAIQIAAAYNPSLLVLMSPYTKIKKVAKDICCWTPWFLKERFNSISFIKNINCKFFLIHGRDDKVIKCHHSEDIYEKAIQLGKEDLWDITIRADMDHNNFAYKVDIIDPIKNFIKSEQLF